MKRFARHAASLGLYTLVPLLSAVAPLLVIPAATSVYGAQAWGSIAVGLSIGVAGAVIGEFGWAIVGPQAVARDPGTAAALYDRALASRLAVALPLAVVTGLTASVLGGDHSGAAALLAVGVTLGALSPSWFCTGRNRPHVTLVAESLPRLVCTGLAAGAIAIGGPLELYGAALIIAALLAVVITARLERVAVVPSTVALRLVPKTIRSQLVLVAGRGTTTLYKTLPTALLAAAAPELVAVYAAADRPLRLGLQFLAALPQRLQAWVAVDDDSVRRGRLRLAILANAVVGVVAGVVFAVAMPFVAPILFAGTITVPMVVSVVAGVLVAVICTSRGLGLALVAERRSGHTTTAAIASALVGVPGTLVGAALGGVPGVFAALALAEAVGAVIQWGMLGRGGTVAPAPQEG